MASNHMGVDISPSTVADGSLFAALDPMTSPQRGLGDGTVAVGADPVGALGTPVVAAAAATTGGTVAAGLHKYVVAAVGAHGVGALSAEASVTTTGATSVVTLTWPAVAGETAGYKVYGRTAGAELHLADVAHGVLTLVDTGSVTPAGALPVEKDEAAAGEKLNSDSPKPTDGAEQPVEGEGDSQSPTEAAEGVEG